MFFGAAVCSVCGVRGMRHESRRGRSPDGPDGRKGQTGATATGSVVREDTTGSAHKIALAVVVVAEKLGVSGRGRITSGLQGGLHSWLARLHLVIATPDSPRWGGPEPKSERNGTPAEASGSGFPWIRRLRRSAIFRSGRATPG
ncbi:hypothetical protein B0H16DRAFT_1465749 [Mycena metata]|uniref:Uncharacterized protein n=1 Tax=Mycena metata TaxID=1033252 RepID=A0AAD7IC94_9AGAR|nr:hypothetical protein B0H16DRAFT_1465749 [Mycena metata]